MRKYRRQVLALLGILVIALVASRAFIGSTYRASFQWEPASPSDSLPQLRVEPPERARVENLALEDGRLVFDVVPLQPGSVTVILPGADVESEQFLSFSVTLLRTVYNQSDGSFTGDIAVIILITLFLAVITAMMLHGFLTAKGQELYAYSTMFYIGFFLFALLTTVTMMAVSIQHILWPDSYVMSSVYSRLGGAAVFFLYCTFLPLLVFSVALAVSNIALLRHNRPRFQNVLGLLISVLMIFGAVFGIWLSWRDFAGSELEYRIDTTIRNVYCAAFAYFECILAGAIICGVRAARHRVPAGREVIIVLGCWFRPDGTLPPLLRGRADRAIAYWQDTLEKTGRQPWIIASGGQGMDEPVPEAEAIRAYLISQGIPEDRILTETKSVSTYQNMLFSRRLMAEKGLPLRCVFATTNYHVFRSGMFAVRAGLAAEGISSRTKWWFWPNAFMRECIGVIANRWKQELVLLLGLVVFFALLSMTMIS